MLRLARMSQSFIKPSSAPHKKVEGLSEIIEFMGFLCSGYFFARILVSTSQIFIIPSLPPDNKVLCEAANMEFVFFSNVSRLPAKFNSRDNDHIFIFL